MGNGEGLVEVHVANIATACSRVCKADLSIEIGTVEIDLTTVLMNDLAGCLNTVFKDTEG